MARTSGELFAIKGLDKSQIIISIIHIFKSELHLLMNI